MTDPASKKHATRRAVIQWTLDYLWKVLRPITAAEVLQQMQREGYDFSAVAFTDHYHGHVVECLRDSVDVHTLADGTYRPWMGSKSYRDYSVATPTRRWKQGTMWWPTPLSPKALPKVPRYGSRRSFEHPGQDACVVDYRQLLSEKGGDMVFRAVCWCANAEDAAIIANALNSAASGVEWSDT